MNLTKYNPHTFCVGLALVTGLSVPHQIFASSRPGFIIECDNNIVTHGELLPGSKCPPGLDICVHVPGKPLGPLGGAGGLPPSQKPPTQPSPAPSPKPEAPPAPVAPPETPAEPETPPDPAPAPEQPEAPEPETPPESPTPESPEPETPDVDSECGPDTQCAPSEASGLSTLGSKVKPNKPKGPTVDCNDPNANCTTVGSDAPAGKPTGWSRPIVVGGHIDCSNPAVSCTNPVSNLESSSADPCAKKGKPTSPGVIILPNSTGKPPAFVFPGTKPPRSHPGVIKGL